MDYRGHDPGELLPKLDIPGGPVEGKSHSAKDRTWRVRTAWEKPKDEVARTGRGQPGRGPQVLLGAGNWGPQKPLLAQGRGGT